jgi:hypothetical protein
VRHAVCGTGVRKNRWCVRADRRWMPGSCRSDSAAIGSGSGPQQASACRPPTVKARNCRVAGAGVRRFAITRSSTVHALGEPSARAAWRRTSMQNGGALDDVRAGLAEGNFSFACARPGEILLGRGAAVRRAAASRGRCPYAANDKSEERATPRHSQRIAHGGACGKTQVVPQNRRPKARSPRSCWPATVPTCSIRLPGRPRATGRNAAARSELMT